MTAARAVLGHVRHPSVEALEAGRWRLGITILSILECAGGRVSSRPSGGVILGDITFGVGLADGAFEDAAEREAIQALNWSSAQTGQFGLRSRKDLPGNIALLAAVVK